MAFQVMKQLVGVVAFLKEGGAQGTQGFDSMVLLIGWMLWKERNERTFSNKTSTVVRLLQDMIDKGTLCDMAGFRQLWQLFHRSQFSVPVL